ncbi:MAG: ThiF family adenylyltransferase [Promethearchaeota archaeon]
MERGIGTENRYTRLKNVKKFGYDIDFDKLREKKVAIVGVGGLGSVAAEMLTRCGVGVLHLFDMDVVDEVNLNRMFFLPSHVGREKVVVVAEVLRSVNRDVEIIPHHGDIMALDSEEVFEGILAGVDLTLNGLDNVPARKYLNAKCVKLGKAYIDAGATRSGLAGYVQPVIPGETACSECVGSIDITRNVEQGEPCTASLPTTMTILAGLQVQEALKLLLGFGKPAGHLNYSAFTNDVREYQSRRDPHCVVCCDKGGSWKCEDEVEETSDEDLHDVISMLSDECKEGD